MPPQQIWTFGQPRLMHLPHRPGASGGMEKSLPSGYGQASGMMNDFAMTARQAASFRQASQCARLRQCHVVVKFIMLLS